MHNSQDILDTALETIDVAKTSMDTLKKSLKQGKDFAAVIDVVLKMQGRLVVSGMGKSGYIAHKIAASFASTGTAALYVHPGEASHGDLGMITEEDVILLLSNSGETQELKDIINYAKRFHIPLIAMTMKEESTLGQYADYTLLIPQMSESSYLGAPTTSALMMLALGDALMVTVSRAKGITKENYKLYHPGGKIGANLLKIGELMHTGDSIPLVKSDSPMSDVLITMSSKGFGCAAVVDDNKQLLGIITDGDLRRHMDDNIVQQSALAIMTKTPKTVSKTQLATEALHIMNEKSITTLMVCDDKIVHGVLHIHDLLRAGVS